MPLLEGRQDVMISAFASYAMSQRLPNDIMTLSLLVAIANWPIRPARGVHKPVVFPALNGSCMIGLHLLSLCAAFSFLTRT
jgi:hypothetical protein